MLICTLKNYFRRPRRSLNPTMKVPEKPVAEAFKLETQPRGVLLAFGMGDAGQLGMGEDVMERKKPQPVKVSLGPYA